MRSDFYPSIPHTSIHSFITLILLIILGISLTSCRNREESLQNDLDRIDILIESKQYDEALAMLLDISNDISPDISPAMRFEIAVRFGEVYYNQYQLGKAHDYMSDAVEYSRQTNDPKLIGKSLWNLALVVNDTDSLTKILSECRDINRNGGYKFLENRARINLSRIAAIKGDTDKAKLIYDSIAASNQGVDHDSIIDLELRILLSDIHCVNKEYEMAIDIINGIMPKNLSLDGKVIRYNRLYQIAKVQHNYDLAFAYRDSLSTYTDSINSIKSSDLTSKIENEYANRLIREQGRRNLAIWTGIGVAILLLTVIFFLTRQRKLKTRQLALVEKISSLNIKIADLTGGNEGTPTEKGMEQPIAEKLRLNKEFFQTLPYYSTLRQLNLIRDADEIDRQKAKEVLDAVIGQFADTCTNLSQLFPTLTKDDALYCVTIYTGFSKEVASVALKASEDALRRRKSRIKQKLSPEMFEFIFG